MIRTVITAMMKESRGLWLQLQALQWETHGGEWSWNQRPFSLPAPQLLDRKRRVRSGPAWAASQKQPDSSYPRWGIAQRVQLPKAGRAWFDPDGRGRLKAARSGTAQWNLLLLLTLWVGVGLRGTLQGDT